MVLDEIKASQKIYLKAINLFLGMECEKTFIFNAIFNVEWK